MSHLRLMSHNYSICMFRCRETTDVYLSTYYVRASALDVSVESLNRVATGAVELSPHRT